MVFGGIIIPAANVEKFQQAMDLWRDSHNMHAEVKWTKVSNQKLAEYRALIDLFFSVAGNGVLAFKSVVFDSGEIDYKSYHQGDKELGFYKFFYQFLLHCFGLYAETDEHRLLVFFDQRTTKYKLSELHAILNRGIRKKYGRKADVVRHIEAVRSHEHDLIQLADVLMGAVGYHYNDCHIRPGARRAKIELADYIARKANLTSLKQKTPWGMRHFSIWPFRFGAGRAK